jgi:predicted porin
MKKSLIALAALAVVSAASAQSSVTLSGLVDFSAIGNGETTTQVGTAAATTSKTNNTGAQSNMATGQVSFSGTEDLGGGLKASFVINTDITGAKAFATRDTFVALAGGFGTVRIGRFTPAAAYGFSALSGHVSVTIGSMYQVGSTGVQTGAITAGSFERNDTNVQYTSPSFSGVTLNANYGTSTTDTSVTLGKLEATQTGLSATYANGPLVIAAGINNREVGAEGTASASGNKFNGDMNWVAASYNLGAAKLFASHVTREDDTTVAAGTVTTNTDVKVTSYGVAVPMGAYTFNASTYTGKNGVSALATDDTKLSGSQLSVRYALSKRTYLYALNGTNKIKLDSGNTAGTATKINATSVGVVHSF